MSAEEKTKRVNIRVPLEIHEYYKTKSEDTGVSMSALMYMDLENWIAYRRGTEELPKIFEKMQQLEIQINKK